MEFFFFARKSFVNFFPDFKLEIGFFSEFAKKVANVPKLTKFIPQRRVRRTHCVGPLV